MNFGDERVELCEAGRTLLAEGLVARTWGNLSIRVAPDQFIISPSGRAYETVSPNDVALVQLGDLRWEGPLKPSSEKELHARIYRSRQDVGAVIHTHQPAASSLAAARQGFVPNAEAHRERLGDEVPCVPYALPTTKALAKAVERTVTGSSCRALLLSNHGALCLAADMAAALRVALALESACTAVILEAFRRSSGLSSGGLNEMLRHYVDMSPNRRHDSGSTT